MALLILIFFPVTLFTTITKFSLFSTLNLNNLILFHFSISFSISFSFSLPLLFPTIYFLCRKQGADFIYFYFDLSIYADLSLWKGGW